MTEDDAVDLLRRAHGEPIDEAHFAAVRRRVVSELAARRRRWQQAWAMAFAVTAALMCLAFWPKPAGKAPAVTPHIETRAAVPMTAPAIAGPAIVIERRTAPAAIRPRHQQPATYTVVGPAIAAPLVVKLITNDPNVVIYWISEKTGE